MTIPSEVLHEMFSHHLWATERLIDHLAGLPRDQLEGAIPGTYGSILSTLTHLIDADERYLIRLRDPSLPLHPDRGPRPLKTLRNELSEHARGWDEALDLLERGHLRARIQGSEDYPEVDDAEGLLLLQAVHHGNDHRTQICSTLGALGEEVPELDGWTYWAEGRG